MSLWNVLSNTLEGTVQVATSTVKATAGVLLIPVDNGETFKQGVEDAQAGLKKIGSDKEPTK